jgi:hypothetical protein
MKTLAYVLFVGSVLLASALARADVKIPYSEVAYQTPIQIEQVTADYANLELLLAGTLPNPCFSAPTAILIPDAKAPNTFVIRLLSPLPTGMCVSQIKPYATVVDLPTLARASQLSFENKAVYVIRTEGYDFEMQVSGADLNR